MSKAGGAFSPIGRHAGAAGEAIARGISPLRGVVPSTAALFHRKHKEHKDPGQAGGPYDSELRSLVEDQINEDVMPSAHALRSLDKQSKIRVVCLCKVKNLGGGGGSNSNPRFYYIDLMVLTANRRDKAVSLSATGGAGGGEKQGAEATMHEVSVAVSRARQPRAEEEGGWGSVQGDKHQVTIHRSWPLESMVAVERPKKGGTTFSFSFKGAAARGGGRGGSDSTFRWEAHTPSALDEMLWGVMSALKALHINGVDAMHVSLKDLHATALYDGFTSRNPMVRELTRWCKDAANTANGGTGDGASGGDAAGLGGTAGKGKNDPDDWVAYDEFAAGEAVLEKLGWREKGQEGMDLALNTELDRLEGNTIEQLILWSEQTDDTQTITKLLDAIDGQLGVMEEWLQQHGQPLELMQRDMAAIEGQNNALEVQWKNFKRLHDYLDYLVGAVSLTPEKEAMLLNPQALLEEGEDSEDPLVAVAQLVQASASLQDAIEATQELETSQNTKSLRFLSEQSAKLVSVRNQFMDNVTRFLKGLFNRLATRGGQENLAGLLDSSSSSQLLLQAQRQFHGFVIDYEPLIQQLARLDAMTATLGMGGGFHSGQGQQPPSPRAARNGMTGRVAELRIAYAEELSKGLLKVRTRQYFAELLPKITYGHSGTSLHTLPNEKLKVGSDRASPDLNSTGGITPGHEGGGGTSSWQEKKDKPQPSNAHSHSLGVVDAVRDAFEHIMPAITREYNFFSMFFSLQTETNDSEKQIVNRCISSAFSELNSNFSRVAEAVVDVKDMVSLLALVEYTQQQPSFQNFVAAGVLLAFRAELVMKFNKWVQQQLSWIEGTKADPKKAGVLVPILKFPSLVDTIQEALSESANVQDTGEVVTAYQKMVVALFQILANVAQRDSKYQHIVRLENFYFFERSMSQRKVKSLEDYVEQARASFELSTTYYLQWLVSYQFPPLVQFFQRLEELCVSVGVGDVPLHEDKKTLEQVLLKHGNAKLITEGLKTTRSRLLKHISKESCLNTVLWDRLSDMLFAMFSRYEEICTLCYSVVLTPSASDVLGIATSIGGGKESTLAQPIISESEDINFGNLSPMLSPLSNTSGSLSGSLTRGLQRGATNLAQGFRSPRSSSSAKSKGF